MDLIVGISDRWHDEKTGKQSCWKQLEMSVWAPCHDRTTVQLDFAIAWVIQWDSASSHLLVEFPVAL